MSQGHVVGLKPYLAVITALLLLTGATVWAAFHDFGALNTPIALGIAAIKALIVAAIFMHLKYSPRINWLFASCGVVFVLIMIAFVVGDVKGEHMQYQAQQWNPPPVAAAAAPQGH